MTEGRKRPEEVTVGVITIVATVFAMSLERIPKGRNRAGIPKRHDL